MFIERAMPRTYAACLKARLISRCVIFNTVCCAVSAGAFEFGMHRSCTGTVNGSGTTQPLSILFNWRVAGRFAVSGVV